MKITAGKYKPFPPILLPDRTWPDRVISSAPVWLSTDLRDGNQSLFNPMDPARKLKLYRALLGIGFKEIEVAFPAASQTDYQFVRDLIEHDLIPADVTIQVMTQAREDLIRRTFEALAGVPRAIVHVYNATAPTWRELVFGMSRTQVRGLAVGAARIMKECAAEHPETSWTFQYSPETFMSTELDYALDVCSAVVDVWDPTPASPCILNLPSTVEVSTPNIFADQIEWMHRKLPRRDSIVLSIHPHNDRGTATATAELALMAGGDRIEGCLFGNGERTGNVDLVTLALNLYSQGVDPGLDFSNLNEIARLAEECTELPTHPRHPYVGDLVFTAFSGSHQDAIKKGFSAQKPAEAWAVPYLPIDPADIGRTYDSVVRLNSQSGKGGVAFVLETMFGLAMPRRMQVEFSRVVQQVTEAVGGEIGVEALWELFQQEYLLQNDPWELLGHSLREDSGRTTIELQINYAGAPQLYRGSGNGPLAAAADALNSSGHLPGELRIDSYEERAQSPGAGAVAVTVMEVAIVGGRSTFGAGQHENIITAALRALFSGLNRLTERKTDPSIETGGQLEGSTEPVQPPFE